MKPAKISLFVATLALLVVSACSTVGQNQSVGAYVDDSVITSRVKAELIKDKAVSGYSIEVDTYDRVVQLSGFVNNHTERLRAIKLAKQTRGVKEVRDAIIVKR